MYFLGSTSTRLDLWSALSKDIPMKNYGSPVTLEPRASRLRVVQFTTELRRTPDFEGIVIASVLGKEKYAGDQHFFFLYLPYERVNHIQAHTSGVYKQKMIKVPGNGR